MSFQSIIFLKDINYIISSLIMAVLFVENFVEGNIFIIDFGKGYTKKRNIKTAFIYVENLFDMVELKLLFYYCKSWC